MMRNESTNEAPNIEEPNETGSTVDLQSEQSATESVNEAGSAKQELEEERVNHQETEIAELKDRLLRAHADFDNYRKRINKEREEWFRYASQDLVEKLLPVLDNFERAILAIGEQNKEIRNVLSGFGMIEKQLIEILQKEGLEPISAVDTDFDPLLHEAVMQVPAEEGVADNQVVEEVRRGYLFKGKLLRASMVKVAKSE